MITYTKYCRCGHHRRQHAYRYGCDDKQVRGCFACFCMKFEPFGDEKPTGDQKVTHPSRRTGRANTGHQEDR